MNFEKNKTSIIIIAVLLVVCVGSFFGVSAMTKNDTAATTNTTLPSTTLPTTTQSSYVPTTQPVATVPSTTQLADTGDSVDASNLITTFRVNTTATTYPTTAPTTVPTTATTTRATTTKAPTTTRATTTKATTSKATTTKAAADGTQENGALFDNGVLSYMFNPEGNYYYTNSDPWQRQLGYNEFYDVGAGFVSIYMDTMRCKFEYGDKDWLIQFWKGQYGYLFIGHEIGVYTKPKDREVEHYDATSENNENALYMSMTGYRDGEELYTREYGKYWWCTGFVPGQLDKFSDRSELQIKCRITMKDYKMLLAFCGALKENGLVLGEDYTTSDLDVFVTW